MALTLRQVLKEAGKRPLKVLLYFPKEKRTGIAPTRLILEKDRNLAEYSKVTVNWQGKKVEAKILALNDNEDILAEKDIEWCKENLLTEEYGQINEQIDPSKRKSSRKENEKVKPDQAKESPVAAQPINRDPYSEFLEEQRKREAQWSANRKSSAAKKARILETSSEFEESKSGEDTKDADEVNRVKQQLEAKDKECQLLRSQVLGQETLCKMLEKFDDSLSVLEENIAQRLSKIERRLESLETVIKDQNDCLPSFGDFPSALCSIPAAPELQTIDIEAFESLSEEVCASTPVQKLAPGTPVPTTPSTSSPEKVSTPSISSVARPGTPASRPSMSLSASSATDLVRDDVLQTCVTPSRIQGVRAVLDKEDTRHRCAVKLLPLFFSKDELSKGNTDGSHKKQSLDSRKLNSLKLLVFKKFPVESDEEKEKQWRFIKTKINARCRASRFSHRDI